MPACVVAFSPWTDLIGSNPSVIQNDGRCAMFRPENMVDFASAYLGHAPHNSPEVSPIYANLAGLPPVLFHVGSTELLLDDSRVMHERILAAGGQSRLDIFDDVSLGWQMLAPVVPEATRSLEQAAAFIEKHL
jgi:acetyl esterase/lipase